MQLWRIRTGRILSPFGDEVRVLPLGTRPLHLVQQDLCRRRGIELADVDGVFPFEVGPGLILFDDSYVNDLALATFIEHTQVPGCAALCLGDDPLGRFVRPPGEPNLTRDPSWPAGLFVLDDRVQAHSAEDLWSQLTACARVVVLPPCPARSERLPGFGGERPHLEIPRARAIAGRIDNWLQVLWLNQILAYAHDVGRRSQRKTNVIGKACRIHPTADLHHCILGTGCQVDAHASLRHCILGDDVLVGDHSVLEGCVLGDRCQTLVDSTLRRVVAFEDATLSSLDLEEVLVGRSAFITMATIFFATLRGEFPEVVVDGKRLNSGRPRLGGCVGHGAVLGTRAIFAPGSVVPNGYTIVMRPEEGVSHIDPTVANGKPSCWDRGRLLPLEQVFPGYRPPELESVQRSI